MGNNLNPVSKLKVAIKRYLRGKTTLAEFQEWLVPAEWEATLESSLREQEILHKVSLLIAEYTSQHRTEPELKTLLKELV